MARKVTKFTLHPVKFLDWAIDENSSILEMLEEELKTEYRIRTTLQDILRNIDCYIPPELVTNPENFTIEQLTCISSSDCVFPPLK